jgi:hypothetical protein
VRDEVRGRRQEWSVGKREIGGERKIKHERT